MNLINLIEALPGPSLFIVPDGEGELLAPSAPKSGLAVDTVAAPPGDISIAGLLFLGDDDELDDVCTGDALSPVPPVD